MHHIKKFISPVALGKTTCGSKHVHTYAHMHTRILTYIQTTRYILPGTYKHAPSSACTHSEKSKWKLRLAKIIRLSKSFSSNLTWESRYMFIIHYGPQMDIALCFNIPTHGQHTGAIIIQYVKYT